MVFTHDDYVTIGARLLHAPAKLASRIEAGEYINMTELLQTKLGIVRIITNDNSFKSTWPRISLIRNLEWV